MFSESNNPRVFTNIASPASEIWSHQIMDFSWTNYPNKPIKELRWEIELLTYFSLKNASLFNNQQVRIETKKKH